MKKSSFKTRGIALFGITALALCMSLGCFWEDDDTTTTPPVVTDTTAPTVESTVPANLEGDYNGTTITVNFSEEMDATTISVSKSGTTCSGSIQLYNSTFSVCKSFDGDLTSSDGKTFTGTVGNLFTNHNGESFKIIVTTAVTDKAGNPLAAQFESSFTE